MFFSSKQGTVFMRYLILTYAEGEVVNSISVYGRGLGL